MPALWGGGLAAVRGGERTVDGAMGPGLGLTPEPRRADLSAHRVPATRPHGVGGSVGRSGLCGRHPNSERRRSRRRGLPPPPQGRRGEGGDGSAPHPFAQGVVPEVTGVPLRAGMRWVARVRAPETPRSSPWA